MTRRQLLSAAAATAAISPLSMIPSPRAHAAAVTVGVPFNPPLVDAGGGRFSGVLVDLLRQISPRLGLAIEFRDRTYAEIYQQLEAGTLDAGLGTLRTDERARHAWYTRAVVTEYSVLAVPKGSPLKIGRSDDLIGKRIGARQGFRYPGPVERPEIELIRAPDHETNARKLVSGDLDVAIVGSLTGVWTLREKGLLDGLDILPIATNAVPFSLALNKQRFTEAELADVDSAIAQFTKENEFYQILAAFRLDTLLRTFPLLAS